MFTETLQAVDSVLGEVIAELSNRLGGVVHLPGSPGYRTSMGGVFFPEASRRHPPCVVHPRSAKEVAAVMRIAQDYGIRLSARGGGLSSNCVSDDAVMVDLSVHLGWAQRDGTRVRVGGGATVATMLEALEPVGRVVPVGVAGLAGFGLVTRGGIGYLTRSVGLTLDHLVEVELVLPGGETVRLSDSSAGRDADLWWAIRGCAPSFGVVTSALLRTHEQGPVYVDRLVTGLDALPAYFSEAPALPRNISMSTVLGHRPGSTGEPVLFIYTACTDSANSAIEAARAATTAVAAASSRPALYRQQTRGRYLRGLPEFTIPGADGDEPAPMSIPQPNDGWFDSKSLLVGPTIGADVAEALTELIAAAPTPSCRIDFQQVGGKLADVTDEATAFKGRLAEWNMSLNAVWDDPARTESCRRWALNTVAALAGETIGVYSVGIRPGLPETESEMQSAFGGGLPRLRGLREKVDPTGVLAGYGL